LDELYDPKLSPEENLATLERLGGDKVRNEIARLRQQKPTPSAAEILEVLFHDWGAPKQR
jgi:hypothetical protein